MWDKISTDCRDLLSKGKQLGPGAPSAMSACTEVVARQTSAATVSRANQSSHRLVMWPPFVPLRDHVSPISHTTRCHFGKEKEERKKYERLKLNIYLKKTELSRTGYLNQQIMWFNKLSSTLFAFTVLPNQTLHKPHYSTQISSHWVITEEVPPFSWQICEEHAMLQFQCIQTQESISFKWSLLVKYENILNFPYLNFILSLLVLYPYIFKQISPAFRFIFAAVHYSQVTSFLKLMWFKLHAFSFHNISF